jgi:hypothetical protein
VADTVVKPVEAVPSTAAVGNGPSAADHPASPARSCPPAEPTSDYEDTHCQTVSARTAGNRNRVGGGQKSVARLSRNEQPRRGVYLPLEGFAGCHAMAAPQLRGEEFSNGPSPSGRGSADEARAIRDRDFLHRGSRDRRCQDSQQMVSRVEIRPKSKTDWTKPD